MYNCLVWLCTGLSFNILFMSIYALYAANWFMSDSVGTPSHHSHNVDAIVFVLSCFVNVIL